MQTKAQTSGMIIRSHVRVSLHRLKIQKMLSRGVPGPLSCARLAGSRHGPCRAGPAPAMCARATQTPTIRDGFNLHARSPDRYEDLKIHLVLPAAQGLGNGLEVLLHLPPQGLGNGLEFLLHLLPQGLSNGLQVLLSECRRRCRRWWWWWWWWQGHCCRNLRNQSSLWLGHCTGWCRELRDRTIVPSASGKKVCGPS